jgi:hypothetical protein
MAPGKDRVFSSQHKNYMYSDVRTTLVMGRLVMGRFENGTFQEWDVSRADFCICTILITIYSIAVHNITYRIECCCQALLTLGLTQLN